MPAVSEKLSISLSEPLARFVEAYRRRHRLKSKSEVVALALKKLREEELIEGLRAMSEDYAREPDAWLDSDLEETLEDGAASR